MEDLQETITVDQTQVLKIWRNYITEDRASRPESLEVETEEETDADETGPFILQSEEKIVIKELPDRKATVDGHVPGNVLKLLGEDGLKLTTKLTKTHTHTHVCVCVCETGEWSKNFVEVTMIALHKKPKSQ
jgi:hypothetical protein